jgi:hypothetical protein
MRPATTNDCTAVEESSMQRFWMSLVALILSLAVVAGVQAAGKGNSGSHPSQGNGWKAPSGNSGSPGQGGHYFEQFGRKFDHGYYYYGRHHDHWSSSYWSHKHGCYFYYDPGCHCYYYFCRPDNCYYPVSYSPYHRYAW